MWDTERRLTEKVRELYPGLPCFLFGHSMGSFIARDPFCAFTRPTNNRSLLSFARMMMVITGPQWAEKVPRKLSFYYREIREEVEQGSIAFMDALVK